MRQDIVGVDPTGGGKGHRVHMHLPFPSQFKPWQCFFECHTLGTHSSKTVYSPYTWPKQRHLQDQLRYLKDLGLPFEKSTVHR